MMWPFTTALSQRKFSLVSFFLGVTLILLHGFIVVSGVALVSGIIFAMLGLLYFFEAVVNAHI